MSKKITLDAALIYPREVTTRDGRHLSLTLAGREDKDRILAFAASLPEDDLLFLRMDITEPMIVDEWMRNIEQGRTVTVLAQREKAVVGYASLHTEGARWTRRVGEIRVQVGQDYRGQGLGKRLVGEIFRLGQDLELRKMAAMMTPDQVGARASFEALGFRKEAVLPEWVVDRQGTFHDLLIMALDCNR